MYSQYSLSGLGTRDLSYGLVSVEFLGGLRQFCNFRKNFQRRSRYQQEDGPRQLQEILLRVDLLRSGSVTVSPCHFKVGPVWLE